MVLLDLQKAFNTVIHGILLNKLQAIGLNQNSIHWFDSYLIGGKQFTEI